MSCLLEFILFNKRRVVAYIEGYGSKNKKSYNLKKFILFYFFYNFILLNIKKKFK
jgi:hypothetical protein